MKTIPLSQGEVAFVSDEDYERVSQYKWSLSHSPKCSPKKYAVARVNGKQTGMHRFILGSPAGKVIDHEDGNGLNNIRTNIRPATNSQNRANSTTERDLPKGVYPRVQRTGGVVFRAQIRSDKRLTNLGTFTTIGEAAATYAKAAKAVHREFAKP